MEFHCQSRALSKEAEVLCLLLPCVTCGTGAQAMRKDWAWNFIKDVTEDGRVLIANTPYSSILFICSFLMIHGGVCGCFCSSGFYPRLVCLVWRVHCRSERNQKKTQTVYKTVITSLSLDSTSLHEGHFWYPVELSSGKYWRIFFHYLFSISLLSFCKCHHWYFQISEDGFSDYKPVFRELNQALDLFSGILICSLMTEVIFKIACSRSLFPFLFVSMCKCLKYLISGVWMQVCLTGAVCEKCSLEFALSCRIEC